MSRHCFKPWGWIYRPASWQGVVVILLGVAFTTNVFLVVDARSHSVSDTLYGLFPYLVPAWILVHWVASKTAPADGRIMDGMHRVLKAAL